MFAETVLPIVVESSKASVRLFELNSVTISGNLVADPVRRETKSGAPVTNFTIVWSRRFRDGKGAEKSKLCILGVVAWHELADYSYLQLRKGSGVILEGELQSKTWLDGSGKRLQFIELKTRNIQCMNANAEEESDS